VTRVPERVGTGRFPEMRLPGESPPRRGPARVTARGPPTGARPTDAAQPGGSEDTPPLRAGRVRSEDTPLSVRRARRHDRV
jgi:hypothetical protein